MATIKDMFPGEGIEAEIAEYLTAIEYRCDIKLTTAQLKLCQDYQIALSFAAMDYKKSGSKYFYEHIGLEEAMKLKEPCFLETYLNEIFMCTLQSAQLVGRYIAVSTPECVRNVLKSHDAYHKKRVSLEKTYEAYKEVYHFAKWYPYDIVNIDNVWRAAWYVMHGYDKIGERHKFTTKQLKKALELPEAIDRYAQIEHVDYLEILSEQSDLLTYIQHYLNDVGNNATMHAFETSEELAEEGMRMGNCIGTYWDHDANSCLFYVEAENEHMDVELIRDNITTEYDVWEVSQVYVAENQKTKLSQEFMEWLEVVVDNFNQDTKTAWLEKVRPKKKINCDDAMCAACINQYVCGFSNDCKLGNPRFDCSFEAAIKDKVDDKEFDEELDDGIEDFDFEAYFAAIDDDELAF